MSRLSRLLTSAAALALLHGCDSDRIAGTNNETQTKGTFFRPDGKPAVGARVRVYSASQKETDSTTAQVAQTFVDADGNVALKLKPGHYSLIADDQKMGGALFIDSAFSDGDRMDLPVDTLRPTGTITGHVRVQPMHSPSIAWVHLMRTNLYANVDSTGFFRISGVPAGNLDLVAVTHFPEYTPTHKLVRARPDSAVDVDTIDLVYNGLPLVTGIVATYDTLSGVVTLSWKDTAYARKAGYIVYRQEGPEYWGGGMRHGYSTTDSFHDTIFGGSSSFRSPVDSSEFDLTYWVGAGGTDRITEGPLWEKVRLHVRSPSLAKRWKVLWGQTVPAPPSVANLDTIEGGLVAWTSTASLPNPETPRSFAILGNSGTWTHSLLPATSLDLDPVFWGGKVWFADLFASTDSLLDSSWQWQSYMGIQDTNLPRTPVYDSVRIRSSADGVHWDTTRYSTGNDSTTKIRLIATSSTLFLEFVMSQYRWTPGIMRTSSQGGLEISQGADWARLARMPDVIETPYSFTFWGLLAPTVLPTSVGDWTLQTPGWPVSGEASCYTLYKGLSLDPADRIAQSTSSILLRGIDSLVVIQRDGFLGLAIASDPLTTQWITSSNSVRSFTFWRGQLVVLRPDGISMATIR